MNNKILKRRFLALVAVFLFVSQNAPVKGSAAMPAPKPSPANIVDKIGPQSIVMMATAAVVAKGSYELYSRYQRDTKQIIPWDWQKIGTDNGQKANEGYFTSEAFKQEFPTNPLKGLLWGASGNAIQDETGITNSTYNLPLQKEKYRALQSEATSEWHQHDTDVALMKQAHHNGHRNSIEWSRVQPTTDTYDMEALDEYARHFAQLIENDITPIIGFHHYSDPQWFMYPNGDNKPVGFENLENGKKYLDYVEKSFKCINDACNKALALKPAEKQEKLKPRFWTFHSPSSYAMNGYQQGERPPNVKSIPRAMNVLENMCKTHDDAYRLIKKIDPTASVGMTTNIYHLDTLPPKKLSELPKYILSILTSSFGNWMSNKAGSTYFTDKNIPVTNPLRLPSAWLNRATFDKKDKTLDWIGVAYYCHGYMDGAKPTTPTNELKTSNPRNTIYAEGLYRAIQNIDKWVAKPLDIPIYITENGFSENEIYEDGKLINGDERRKLFLNRHLYAIAKAIKDGYNVKGYMYWSLFDNVEWKDGYKKNYGLATKDRVLKPSGDYYAQIIDQIKE